MTGDTGYTCDNPDCPHEGNATETLWLRAPLGLCAVHVHRDHACANGAREARGGGKFVPEPMTTAERDQRARRAELEARRTQR